ncbi:MAG TPA: hypothetical protein VGY55_12280 [Pirellulales bacterium]|nr:hypothetical protein [Pirellulales bacterium]
MSRSLKRLVCVFTSVAVLTAAYATDSRAAESAIASTQAATQSLSPAHDPARNATSAAVSVKGARPLNPRVVFIVKKDCAKCDQELARLQRAGGDFEKMRAIGWLIGEGPENQVQIVDRDQIPELVRKLDVRDYPTVACIDNGEVVRSFKSGCTTPLDAWTFGFLAKGVDERPPGAVLESARVETTGSYRLRGNHWSVEGDWNPTRDRVIEHLRGPNHLSELEPQWHIDSWSYEELRSLHDDLHERYDTYTSSSSSPPEVRHWKGG